MTGAGKCALLPWKNTKNAPSRPNRLRWRYYLRKTTSIWTVVTLKLTGNLTKVSKVKVFKYLIFKHLIRKSIYCEMCTCNGKCNICCGCSFLFPMISWHDFIQTFLFSHRNEKVLHLTVFPASPVHLDWGSLSWGQVSGCVCICECDLTCAGSPCLPAVWGEWDEISCWPVRPPCPRSPSSLIPGWLNG